MNLHELQALVANGETEILEFKKSTGQLTVACKTLCGFLNYRGGILLFGVEDNNNIIGQMVSDQTKRQIVAELNKITPKPDYEMQYIDLVKSEKKVIVIHVIQNQEKTPYMYDNRAYFREQTITSILDQEKYNLLLMQRLKLDRKWDRSFSNEYTIADLDLEEVKTCIAEGVNAQRLPMD